MVFKKLKPLSSVPFASPGKNPWFFAKQSLIWKILLPKPVNCFSSRYIFLKNPVGIEGDQELGIQTIFNPFNLVLFPN